MQDRGNQVSLVWTHMGERSRIAPDGIRSRSAPIDYVVGPQSPRAPSHEWDRVLAESRADPFKDRFGIQDVRIAVDHHVSLSKVPIVLNDE